MSLSLQALHEPKEHHSPPFQLFMSPHGMFGVTTVAAVVFLGGPAVWWGGVRAASLPVAVIDGSQESIINQGL